MLARVMRLRSGRMARPVHHSTDDAILLDAGPVTTSERCEEPYDPFRSRIIFPNEELTGMVIAFGGRLFGPGKGAKYLNSPETPVYHKGKEQYGLNRAPHEPYYSPKATWRKNTPGSVMGTPRWRTAATGARSSSCWRTGGSAEPAGCRIRGMSRR